MQVRNWAVEFDSLYVVTGPIFDSVMLTIGPHQVAVPKAYYKVLLQKRNGNWVGIGFILPNSNTKVNFKDYATNIDKVEEITGLDFFWKLENQEQNKLERNLEQKFINCK